MVMLSASLWDHISQKLEFIYKCKGNKLCFPYTFLEKYSQHYFTILCTFRYGFERQSLQSLNEMKYHTSILFSEFNLDCRAIQIQAILISMIHFS